MGFYSFKTADTNESICNVHTGKHRPVYLLMPDGNHILECAYQGYGIFGGHRAYDLLAEMNGYEGDGLDLHYSDRYNDLPFQLKFSFDPNANYHDLPASEDCEAQGYFL